MLIFHTIQFLRLIFTLLVPLFILLSTDTVIFAGDEESSPINIHAKVDKTGVTTGDTLTFSISIIGDPDIKPNPPYFDSYFTGFEILDNGIKGPNKDGKKIKTEIWYRLRADETGEFVIPPVPVTFSAPDSKYPNKIIQGQILTPEVTIDVLSVLRRQGEPKDIRDIKSILEFEPDWQLYALFALLAILALTLFFIWAGKNKHPRKLKRESKLPPLLPHDLAFKELRVLRSKALLEQGMYREHYFELSEIFRRYLSARFRFPALDWTTEEITDWIDKNRLLTNSSRVSVWDILDNTDQVKYAKAKPPDFASESIMEAIVQFIQETIEKPQPEEPQRQGAI